MKRLLTKCCLAERNALKDEYGIPERIYCEQCEVNDPEIDWFEMCDYCERPDRYCVCP